MIFKRSCDSIGQELRMLSKWTKYSKYIWKAVRV